jgi:hypothetical protein
MPYDAEGRWTPPANFPGWDDYKASFRRRVKFEHLDAVDDILRRCHLLRLDPTAMFKKFLYWNGDSWDRYPDNWPPCLDAKDWDSFRAFVRNETATEMKKVLTPTEV